MFDIRCARALLALALVAPPAQAATDEDIAQLREEIRQLRQSYEARIQALEARVREAAASAAGANVPPPQTAVPSSAAASSAPRSVATEGAPGPSASAPSTGESPVAGGGLSAFNPAISAVLSGAYGRLSQDPTHYGLSAFALGEDVSPGRRGLGLGESEITLSANVDHLFAGNLTVSLTPENTLSVEEAYGVTTSLGNGLGVKFGRFFSGLGYLNEQHQHAWDFHDAPLPYQAFLAGQYTTDGAQLKWLLPTDEFVELGAEIGNGDSFPGSERNSNSVGAADVFVHAGGDIGASHSWRAGLSYLDARPNDRVTTQYDRANNLVETALSGSSRTVIADAVWKYAPNGNPLQTNFKLQGEYFWRRESGELTYDADGALGLTSTAPYSSTQSGGYLQGVWQFMPQWRTGFRYDRLNPGSPSYGANAVFLAVPGFHPQGYTFMVDWTPSEFSRWRLQYGQNQLRPDVTDNEWFLQYILTLGAHGAHKF